MAVSTLAKALTPLFLITGMMASLAANIPVPDRNPQDWIRDGCAIQEHSDEGAKRWPLTIWVDILNVPPDPDCQTEPKHSWCNQYSMRDSLEGAQKDCAKFLKDVRKELKKVGR